MTVRALTLLTGALVLTACRSESPSAPSGGETISGSERFGWDQPAADAAELATFRYAIYVDDARSEAAGVSCAAAAVSGRFSCSSSLPSMSNGNHTLSVASFVVDGGAVRESPRSAPVSVVKR
jgi:hypothetical protein